MRKEAELTRAEETIRREQQQMRQLVRGLPQDFPFTGVCVCVGGGGGGGGVSTCRYVVNCRRLRKMN